MLMGCLKARECARVTGPVEFVLSRAHKLSLASTPEWRQAWEGHHNMLLEGPEDSTHGVLLLLESYLRKPVVWKRSRAPFELPAGEFGALVLQNVAALNREGQTALLRWLDDPADRKQVVSTTVHPLFPLVVHGLFDETLYYRLNVVLLHVDSSSDAALHQRHAEEITSSQRPLGR